MNNEVSLSQSLFSEIRSLIDQGRQQVAVTVNAAMTLLYWQVGKRINDDILKNNRAEYGRGIVNALSAQLVSEYGKGWIGKHLRYCLRSAETIELERTG